MEFSSAGRRSEYGNPSRMPVLVFHDLHHCFNTYMRKAGVAESIIMRITGHSSREMFDRYNRVYEPDMKDAVAQMGTFPASVDQNVDQTPLLQAQRKWVLRLSYWK